MRAFSSIVLCLGISSLVGCGTTNNTTVSTEPNANGVFPANGFAGRELRVEVTGDATAWSASTTVSFGAGVTVKSTSVASPTDLFVDVTIAPDAAIGQNDVVITDGSDTFTLTKAFEIDAPGVLATSGTVAQGSVAAFTITNKDIANPYDTTSTSDPLTGAVTFTNVKVTGPSGLALLVDNVTPFAITGTLLIDTDAADTGAVTVSSGPTGSVVDSVAGDITVAKRSPMSLVAGTNSTGTISTSLGTDLYSFTSAAGATRTSYAVTSADGSPAIILLPASGHFADLVAFNSSIDQFDDAANSYFAIVWDNTGTPTYSYTLSATALSLTTVAAVTTNTTPTAPQIVATPGLVTGAQLTSDTDEHWYKVTVSAADVTAAKDIHVSTLPGDPQTDTVLEVFGPNSSTTSVSGPVDNNFQEDARFTPSAAGTYLVKVSYSNFAPYDATNSHYNLAIILE